MVAEPCYRFIRLSFLTWIYCSLIIASETPCAHHPSPVAPLKTFQPVYHRVDFSPEARVRGINYSPVAFVRGINHIPVPIVRGINYSPVALVRGINYTLEVLVCDQIGRLLDFLRSIAGFSIDSLHPTVGFSLDLSRLAVVTAADRHYSEHQKKSVHPSNVYIMKPITYQERAMMVADSLSLRSRSYSPRRRRSIGSREDTMTEKERNSQTADMIASSVTPLQQSIRELAVNQAQMQLQATDILQELRNAMTNMQQHEQVRDGGSTATEHSRASATCSQCRDCNGGTAESGEELSPIIGSTRGSKYSSR